MLQTLPHFEYVTSVQDNILHKKGSFILLLPAGVNWLHQKTKRDRPTVLALSFPIPSYHPVSRNSEERDSKFTLQPLRVFGKGLQRKSIVCSSFPRSPEAHAEKTNITRKQHGFLEVTEKSYSVLASRVSHKITALQYCFFHHIVRLWLHNRRTIEKKNQSHQSFDSLLWLTATSSSQSSRVTLSRFCTGV